MVSFSRNAVFATLAFCLAATFAVADENQSDDRSDPLETLNRFVSGFNTALRKAILDPVVDIYQFVTPDDLEGAISNAASNLSEPVTAVSSVLQGDTENAGNAMHRFLVNTTIGVGGLGDPATGMGIESRREDLGQAFATNGMESGPHLVLPILGPSNFRDALGDLATAVANPLPLVGKAATGVVNYSDNQDTINGIGNNALDPYVAEREAYEQHRQYEISNGIIILPETDTAQSR
jgi:phospholipid-binding lipoprotein MlaA